MDLKVANTQRWNNCHISAANGPAFEKVANRIKANKAVYDEISKETNVPWWFIGIVHYREANLDMNANLAQGDPWNKKSTHVPKGRGPFGSFKEAAIDALKNCAPYAAKNTDWSVGGSLAKLEEYNGLGYANRAIPSPYLWAGTDQYVKGKYTSDGVFSPDAVDKQLGCAGLLKFLGIFSTTGDAVKPVSNGTMSAGAVVASGAVAATQAPHNYLPYIVAGTIAVAVITLIAVDVISYMNWKKNNGVS